MGEVFIARQTSVGREVAVKVLSPEATSNVTHARRFLREVRAASALKSRHIVTIHDFGQTEDGLLYLVMERVDGAPLTDLVEAEAPLPVSQAVALVDQMLVGLEAAHATGVVHRDLKPDNVLLSELGEVEASASAASHHVTLVDFGIAGVAGREGTALTLTGQVCGTPDYIAPERALGKVGDHRVDLYAVGVILYEMLAGERPFKGRSAVQVMSQHVNEAAPPLTGVPPALQALVSRALAKRPEDRHSDAAAMRAALQALEAPVDDRPGTLVAVEEVPPVVAEVPEERPAPQRRSATFTGVGPVVRRSWWPLVLGGVLLVVLAGVIGWLLRPGAVTEAPPPPPAAAMVLDAGTLARVVPAAELPDATPGVEGPDVEVTPYRPVKRKRISTKTRGGPAGKPSGPKPRQKKRFYPLAPKLSDLK